MFLTPHQLSSSHSLLAVNECEGPVHMDAMTTHKDKVLNAVNRCIGGVNLNLINLADHVKVLGMGCMLAGMCMYLYGRL